MSLIPFSRQIRSLSRLGHVVTVLSRHGFGWFVVSLRLERLVPFRKRLLQRREPPEQRPDESTAARVARVLEELGPTYVKLGQVLGSRTDLLPPAFIREFRKLQDRVKPFPTPDARAQVSRQLGGPIEEFYDDFGAEPFAAGSIAQAYAAKTKDGEDVVVKVRRPGIRDVLEADIDILLRLADLAERYVPEYRVYRPVMLVEEFAQTVRREIDFVSEASNTQRFRRTFEENPNIRVPNVLWDLTAAGVLTLERIEGVPIYDEDALDRIGADRQALGRHLTECFMRQYFELGLFHADPHPGNLVVQAPDVLGILDFGQIGRLSDAMRSQLGTVLVAALNHDFDIVVDVFDDLAALPDDLEGERLKGDLAVMTDKYAGVPIGRLNLKDLFDEITATARRHRVVLPRDFVLLGKSMVAMGGVALGLDPDIKMVEVVRPKVRRLMAEKASPRRLAHHGLTTAYHLAAMAEQGPRSLRQLMRKLIRGRFQILFRHENLDHLINELDRSSNRIAFALIVASIILGSAIMLQAQIGPNVPYTEIPLLGMLGFFIAGLLGVWLVIAILRSGRL
ncbi:MAG: AarF/ABC1/UbiB kinase family protein [Phycisphaerae bacterium]